jgi:Rod binding domain-containing protein
MIDAPLDVVTAMPVSRMAPAGRRDAAFAPVLEQAAQGRDRQAARDAATRLVSSAFVMPVLASMHDSPFLEPPFAPTFAQKQFQPLLDRHLSDRITGSANFPLVDVIVDRLLGPEPPAGPGGKPNGEPS